MKPKPAIKISKKLKNKLDGLITKKGETYEDIINGLFKWKWYKQRNKHLEQVFHQQDEEINEYQKEIARLQKSSKPSFNNDFIQDFEDILENYRGDYFKVNIHKFNELKKKWKERKWWKEQSLPTGKSQVKDSIDHTTIPHFINLKKRKYHNDDWQEIKEDMEWV